MKDKDRSIYLSIHYLSICPYDTRCRPLVLEADERPLDVEDVVADHVRFAVFDQELEVVHGFLNVLLMQHVAQQAQVDISWRGTRSEVRLYTGTWKQSCWLLWSFAES